MSASTASMVPDIPSPPSFTSQQKIFTVVGVLLGMLLSALDQTIVSTAGPAIQKDLHIEPSLYVWITTSYIVASTVCVPIYGKLSDLFGRRRILLTGIFIFLVGSVLCGISSSAAQLIAFRGLQGLGSAALFTSAFSVIADIFPPSERGKYQGIFGAVFGLSSVVGPLLGGYITDHFGWHWVFFVNLPIGAVAVAFILAKMPPLRPVLQKKPSIDVLGSLCLIIASVPMLLALSFGKNEVIPGQIGYLWTSWQILSMFAVSLIGIVVFIFVEKRAQEPIIDMGLFRNRAFAIGSAASFVAGSAFLGAFVFLPLFMVNVVGTSNTDSGLTTTPLTLGLVAGNIISGQIASRTGKYKNLMLAAMGILIAGFAVMAFTLSPESTQGEVTLKMVLIGIGLGPTIPLFTLAIQNAVPPEKTGVATSAATFFRSMGSTVGVAVLGTIFAINISANLKEYMAKALDDVPAPMREQLMQLQKAQQNSGQDAAAAAGESAGEGAVVAVGFPADAIKEKITARFAGIRSKLNEAKVVGAPGVDEQIEKVKQQEQESLAAVDRLQYAFKSAFTDAVKKIYLSAIFLAVIALIITMFLPELPLRKTMGGPPPAAE